MFCFEGKTEWILGSEIEQEWDDKAE